MFASHYFTLTLQRISQCFRYSKFNMKMKNIINLLLICWGVFVTGVSLTLLTPFYPSEALSKVRSLLTSLLVSDLSFQGVTVTQSGVVLSTVFVATLIFTPIFGKEFINNFAAGKYFKSKSNIFFLILKS